MCTNGKKYSEEAIRFASEIFGVFKPEITILFAGAKDKGEFAVNAGIKILESYNLKVDIQIKESVDINDTRGIAMEIVKEAENGLYDLLVLGSRGVSETIPGVSSYVLGDVPREVVKCVRISTLIVKEPEKLEKVLVAINGSDASKEAAFFWGLVVNQNKWDEQKINLLTVTPELYGHSSEEIGPLTEEQLLALGQVTNEHTRRSYEIKKFLYEKYKVKSYIRLREGEVVEEILKETERDYDLIVLGREESGGNTFEAHLAAVVEQAQIPVLVIRRDAVKKIFELI